MKMIFILLALFVNNRAKPIPPLKISVLYFSTINEKLRAELLQNITATYHCTVTEIKGIATLPAEAFYKPRNRYRAPVLLEYLKGYSGYDKIIGITSKDISTTHNGRYDWGDNGVGVSPGKVLRDLYL